MESKKICDIDLKELGFDDNDLLETKYHTISYLFYDIGRLSIKSKPKYGYDDIYIEDYFDIEKFINIIFYITGHKIEYKFNS